MNLQPEQQEFQAFMRRLSPDLQVAIMRLVVAFTEAGLAADLVCTGLDAAGIPRKTMADLVVKMNAGALRQDEGRGDVAAAFAFLGDVMTRSAERIKKDGLQ